MKLSYVIPVYNAEKYLCEAIDSILDQSMDDYEIILVNDGSKDNSASICDAYVKEYPQTVKAFHKENGGPAKARNIGIDMAKGDYIYFFDSDDVFISDGIRKIYNAAVEKKADIVQFSFYKKADGEDVLEKIELSFELDKVYGHRDMEKELCRASKKGTTVFPWRNIYRREFLLNNNIRFPEELRMVEDTPFNVLAFAKAERVIAVDEPIYCYKLHDNSLQRKKYIEDYDKIICYQWNLKLKYYEENCKAQKEFYSDIGEYTVKVLLPVLLNNVYSNHISERYKVLKRIGNSIMLRRSFEDYDINEFKSRSLDWWMTFFIKHKFYLGAHFLCERVLYK